jgi:hypothetical protein
MACSCYKLDMAATQFGACICGYAKKDHSTDMAANQFGARKPCQLPRADHTGGSGSTCPITKLQSQPSAAASAAAPSAAVPAAAASTPSEIATAAAAAADTTATVMAMTAAPAPTQAQSPAATAAARQDLMEVCCTTTTNATTQKLPAAAPVAAPSTITTPSAGAVSPAHNDTALRGEAPQSAPLPPSNRRTYHSCADSEVFRTVGRCRGSIVVVERERAFQL